MKTSAPSHLSDWHLRGIRRRTYTVAQTRVTCTLYAFSGGVAHTHAVGYAIGMKTRDDRVLYFLGHDAAWAVDVFERVTKYAVSPCTLKDVLDDLQAGKR